MKDNLTTTVIKERHKRKPVKYWTANIPVNWRYEGEQPPLFEIDRHESIAILRARNNPNCIFKSYR